MLNLQHLVAEHRIDAAFLHALWHYFGAEPFERGNLDAARLNLLFGREVVAADKDFDPLSYEAMLVIAAGASVNAMFSDSPYYLQFIKRSRDVFVTTAFAMVLNIVLTVALSHHLGMLGAAYGYSISMSLFFLVQRAQVSRHLRGRWRGRRRR